MPNKRNVELLATLKENLERAQGSFFLVNYQGLPAKETHALRQALKQNGARLFVAKNTLIRLALKELGLPELDGLQGPSAVVFYEDPVAAAKTLVQFAKSNPKGRACLPEQIAQVLLFLASDDSSAINGAEIRADGAILGMGL